jgi:hypothetical protein
MRRVVKPKVWRGHSCGAETPVREAGRLRRLPFASLTTCHPEAPSSGAEGPMQLADSTAAAGESTGPSARKKRGPQDDNTVLRAFGVAGGRES